MELYTLSSKFLPKESVGQFTSAIWTERYFSAGDVQLVVQAIPSQIEKLAKGTFLGLRGTKEIMMIETQSVEDGLLTVTGSSILEFLNERQAWFKNPEYDGSDSSVHISSEYTSDTLTAGELISSAVEKLVINPIAYGTVWTPINLDWSNETIPGLQLGVVDNNGTPKRLSIPLGQLYESIQRLAEEEGLGLKLYLESARYNGGIAPPDYRLEFATYRGKNRTSDQSVHALMRLSPKLDSLTDVKEINSISNYKNVFYVVYKNEVSIHYIPGLPVPTGFDRRVILVEAPDIFLEPDHIPPFREQVARNTIANHVYIQAVDGQISQQTGYAFGKDYYLGDIIELEGFTGLLSKARVTEYIRSEDQFGEKAYPTLSVLDPLFVGYMPDLEPDSDFDPGFDDDPDYDFDLDYSDEDDLADPEIRPSSKDPRDPPEHNPDPTYDFADDHGEDGTGIGGGGIGPDRWGGQLTLHPGNIHEEDGLAWYEHHDHIYLEGTIYYGVLAEENGDPGGLITIEGGVPEEARPASDVSFTAYPVNDSDRLYGNFDTFDGTVTTDGTIRVSPVPVPSDKSVNLWLMLNKVSWPVNPLRTGSPSDTVAQESLEPWLIQNYPFLSSEYVPTATSQGAVIGAHGIRSHLNGKATFVDPVVGSGNILQKLPPKYRPVRNDWMAIPMAGKWWPAYLDKQGALNLDQQWPKPLLRALSLSDGWLHGTSWIDQSDIDTSFSYFGLPINLWLGPAPEAPCYIQGHWSPPPVNVTEGAEFGFIMSYGVSPFGLDQFWYKMAAEKMENGQWWLMLTIFYDVHGQETGANGYTRIPMARLDTDFVYGEMPNGIFLKVGIEPFGPDKVKISTNISGTTHIFEWPQQDDMTPPVWPSQINGSAKWGAIYTIVDADSRIPISNLTNLMADYTIPSGSTFYPPTWLPNHGYPSAGDQVDLNDVGWRVNQ